jgi:thiamine-phosphate pyrophosphorylase
MRQASFAIEAGVDFFQIRERDLEAATLAALVAEVVALARGTSMRVIVNDRLDVALACGAAGVHLPADAIPPAAARAIAPPGFVIGRSVHRAQEAAAVGEDVDYLIAGTMWPTESKPGDLPLLGPTGLRGVVGASKVPVLAIGGVTLDRLVPLRMAGAAGIAAIGLFIGPRDERGCRAAELAGTVNAARAVFDTPAPAS